MSPTCFAFEGAAPASWGDPVASTCTGKSISSMRAGSSRTPFSTSSAAATLFVGADTFISADWGTVTTIGPGGSLEIDGNGGYYQGTAVAGQPLGRLINNGTLSKTGGGSTSIVEADYVQGASGQVTVDCCAVLAFAGHHLFRVRCPRAGAWALAAAARDVRDLQRLDNPAIDVMSVKLSIPSANPQAASVAAPGADPAAADHGLPGHRQRGLRPRRPAGRRPANPATIMLRFSQADVMATPLSEVQVGHISDAGVMTKTPDCISGTLPPGAPYCIDRAAAVAHHAEHLRHRADHPDVSLAAAPPGARGELRPERAGRAAGPGRHARGEGRLGRRPVLVGRQ